MAPLAVGARQLPITHISIRVPWHDSEWNGTVCEHPGRNSECLILPRIRATKNDEAERRIAGVKWSDLTSNQLPVCAAERASFMAPFGFTRILTHPYFGRSDLHKHFDRTPYHHLPYSAACIPFRWMLRENAPAIADTHQINFVPDLEDRAVERMGFGSDWLQTKRNQLAFLDTFFSAIAPEESLCFIYAKQTPLCDESRRVIVGIGKVVQVGKSVEYEYSSDGDHQGMVWERDVQHSIRPGFKDGFLFPLKEILELAQHDPTINPAEFVAFAPDEAWNEFSYGAEHISHDIAISTLLGCADTLGKISKVLPGDWDRALRWIDQELNRLWKMRGPCPGLGSALSAFGVEHGNFVAHEIASAQSASHNEWNENPWPLVDQVFENPSILGSAAKSISSILSEKWKKLPEIRKNLLTLLSRFALNSDQATRFYQKTERQKAAIETNDDQILENPYLIFELDRDQPDAIDLGTVDRGIFPDPIVREKHPLPSPSALDGAVDPRRVRAFVVHELERKATQGHTLQPRDSVIQSIRSLDIQPPCPVDEDLMALVEDHFGSVIQKIHMAKGEPAYQLDRLSRFGELIRRMIENRIRGRRHHGAHSWRAMLDEVFDKIKGQEAFSEEEKKLEEDARHEKTGALKELYASRISVLLGPAGTGKTTLLNILCNLPEISDGVLLLAPTGKARVRMEEQAGIKGAKTIAQFLLPLGRYNPATGAYKLSSQSKQLGVRTLIIDEASMLTEEQLGAVIDAVQAPERLILVGDPQQLPPIGAGRPFLDIVRRLTPENIENTFPKVGLGYAELTVRRRHIGQERDDLLLAEWFSGRSPEPGCDEIWDRLISGHKSAYIRLVRWETDEDLHQKLLDCMVEEIDQLSNISDSLGFEMSLGGSEYNGRAYFWEKRGGKPGAAEKAEAWQILSPVRANVHGVDALNRLIQSTFRTKTREFSQSRFRTIPKPMGGEQILYGDKVINTVNRRRDRVWPESEALKYVANGEIGIVVGQYKGKNWKLNHLPNRLEVEFTTQLGFKYTYGGRDFADEGENTLSLAYALTVHKAQGSEFGITFIILPQQCWNISRELLYTAFTRHRNRLIVLYQGDFSNLRKYTTPYYSDTPGRLTNIFDPPKLVGLEDRMFEDRLIHKTRRGEAVRSKSEVIVADLLYSKDILYEYEKELRGHDHSRRYPDFTIENNETGDFFYWEHLGMLRDPYYRSCWTRKLEWYKDQEIRPLSEGGGSKGTLIITQDNEHGGIDSAEIESLIEEVFGV